MDYYESNIITTLKLNSNNKKRMEELILEMLKVNGIDNETANIALNSIVLLKKPRLLT